MTRRTCTLCLSDLVYAGDPCPKCFGHDLPRCFPARSDDAVVGVALTIVIVVGVLALIPLIGWLAS